MASPVILIPTVGHGPSTAGHFTRRRATLHRLLQIVIAALALTALLQLAYRVAVAPGVRLSTVLVDTPLPLSDAEVLRMAGVAMGDRFSDLRLAEIAARLESFPDVASASAVRQFPDTLALTLRPRQPVVVLMATNARGSSVTFTVDAQGVLYQAGLPTSLDLPLLSGMTVGEVEIGSDIGQQLRPLVQDLALLAEEEPYLASLISQVDVRPRGGKSHGAPGFDSAVYTVHYPVPLLFGESVSAAAVSEGLLVLEALTQTDSLIGVVAVDMRGGPPVLASAADADAGE